jgi:hypothetical protein
MYIYTIVLYFYAVRKCNLHTRIRMSNSLEPAEKQPKARRKFAQ